MPSADKSLAILRLERKILRAICREGTESSVPANFVAQSRTSTIAGLLSHNWQDAEHRVVFDALVRLPGRDAAELRSQLPAQTTRMGFPDVEWETYFAGAPPHDANSAGDERHELETLIAKLRSASAEIAS
jgi:hypothetical protein